MPELPSPPPPAEGGDRLPTLDGLRGLAVMGILLANLPAFGLPESAYFSPLAWGGTGRADIAAWFATYVLVEGKMRGLFSLLFGASLLLVVGRAEAAGGRSAAIHYRRMAWLFAIGLIHLYALWWGDILAHYALCGAMAFAFVRVPARGLVAVAVALVAWQTIQATTLYLGIVAAQHDPTMAGGAFLRGMTMAFGRPPAAMLAAEIAAYRGSYAQAVAWRWHDATDPLTLLPILGPETLATMLLGMAGLKSGFLEGAWPRIRYARVAVVALGVSLPLYAAAALHTIHGGFALADVVFGAMVLAAPLRNVAILGYAALGILLLHSDDRPTGRIAAAGRMALSNYLLTTLTMTGLFYGLGLFGRLPRVSLYLLAPPVWIVMLAWSKPWLDHYRHGPAEWLWRSLARGRVQLMRRSKDATIA